MSQQDYRTGFDNQTTEKIYGRRRGCARKGCIVFPIIILLIAGILAAGYFILYPMITPNTIRGELLDMAIVPGSDASDMKIWIHTDGSFHYIQETKSPGRHSIGRKGLFCKTWTYIFDPLTKKIIKKFKTDYDEIPPTPKLFYINGKVWMVSNQQFNYEPMIKVYNSETGELEINSEKFINLHPEFSSGLAELYFKDEHGIFTIKTKDGQSLIYSAKEDKTYKDDAEFRKSSTETSNEIIKRFCLGSESSSERQKLYLVTGPAEKIIGGKIGDSYLKDPKQLEYHYKSSAKEVLADKVFLEGLIQFQDNDCVLILHQDQVGKNANRQISCIDTEGNLKWTIPQSDLFDKMKVSEKDAFSVIFFMKDKIEVERSGNLVIVKFEPEGIICFDYKTGKKLWELEI